MTLWLRQDRAQHQKEQPMHRSKHGLQNRWRVVDTADHFGCVVTDIRRHWTGISPEGGDPSGFMFLWANYDAGWRHADPHKLVIDNRNRPPEGWMDKPANSKRRRDLVFIGDRCNGLFHVAWIWVKDPDAKDRRARYRLPDRDLIMKLTDGPDKDGRFAAESVAGWRGSIPSTPSDLQ
jgi:hypothetical protein